MKTNMPCARIRVQLRMREHGTKIILHYVVMTGVTVDTVSGTETGTATPRQKVIRGFFHEVGPATSGLRVYSEIEIGDAIIDIPPDVSIDGLKEPEFEINGRRWVQKEVSRDLAKSWDAVWADQRMVRTILLCRKAVFK